MQMSTIKKKHAKPLTSHRPLTKLFGGQMAIRYCMEELQHCFIFDCFQTREDKSMKDLFLSVAYWYSLLRIRLDYIY